MADALEKRREDTSTSAVRPRSPYSKRFMFANLLVAAGFAAVLVLFGVLVSRESSTQAWSVPASTLDELGDRRGGVVSCP